jgi:hypothetical protein
MMLQCSANQKHVFFLIAKCASKMQGLLIDRPVFNTTKKHKILDLIVSQWFKTNMLRKRRLLKFKTADFIMYILNQ